MVDRLSERPELRPTEKPYSVVKVDTWKAPDDDEVGNSTNGWKVLESIRERDEPFERIVIFTDMQIWDSSVHTARNDRTVKAEFDVYRKEASDETALYLVDLASYGDLVTPEGYENVYNISGWSENVLAFIEHAETPMQVIDEIDAVEPV